MPYKDPEKKKEYTKKWQEKNKEKQKEYMKKYVQENKEKLQKLKKNYNDNNHNVMKISQWISSGIKLRDDEDWDSVYIQWFIQEECDDCNCQLTFGSYGNTRKCLDHDHTTGFIRGIVCHGCNLRRA
tara:strand:- start:53 stop:433 length:381 start_codon:yes stop_codon:yes gene_type:complete